MKPFDLQAALAGAKVVTRDGREVKIAGYNPDALGDCQLLGWSGIYYSSWYSDGKSEFGEENDLFMAPTERKEWVVRKPTLFGDLPYFEGPYYTEAGAKESAGANGTIHEITVIE